MYVKLYLCINMCIYIERERYILEDYKLMISSNGIIGIFENSFCI